MVTSQEEQGLVPYRKPKVSESISERFILQWILAIWLFTSVLKELFQSNSSNYYTSTTRRTTKSLGQMEQFSHGKIMM